MTNINIKDYQNGESLRQIQARLHKLGYHVLVDGLNGPMTQEAWRQFKTDHYQADPEIVGAGSLKLLYTKSDQAFLTKEQLEMVWQRTVKQPLFEDLLDCLVRFSINTPNRIRHFLSQTGHESGGGRWLIELGTPSTIKTKPSGGFKYRGAGVLQLTHDYNYRTLASVTGDARVMEGAEYVAAKYPCTSAGVWWQANGMNLLIDKGATVREVTRKVNGGFNGLADRERRYRLACQAIK